LRVSEFPIARVQGNLTMFDSKRREKTYQNPSKIHVIKKKISETVLKNEGGKRQEIPSTVLFRKNLSLCHVHVGE
jgi:hypothetical protein